MINQRDCPFCKTPSAKGCPHLALVAEGRDFVRRCIERCDGQQPWTLLCQQRKLLNQDGGGGREEDFTWLETAFCDEFLRPLVWFGGMDHEWRSGPRSGQGGFWVLLWSKDPRRLWWDLREELERRCALPQAPQESVPWLIWMNPR